MAQAPPQGQLSYQFTSDRQLNQINNGAHGYASRVQPHSEISVSLKSGEQYNKHINTPKKQNQLVSQASKDNYSGDQDHLSTGAAGQQDDTTKELNSEISGNPKQVDQTHCR